MNTRPLGAELFHADGQTDRHDEANSRFLQIMRTRLKSVSEILLSHQNLHRLLTQNFVKISICKHPTISQWVLKTKLILL